ncbi:hypothetical protein GQ55_4G253300 [Panicum hallii var. hallii]|uniref:Knottin scorpion toxin-like domain-containing protein n=1 Tax=Panicum hallii var. hallii TaxID=1504633 RepID=A0A2T7E015_9POAL|nr:hypothetical protein GQ55_4G253300 [Panicum hallii var. hallii]
MRINQVLLLGVVLLVISSSDMVLNVASDGGAVVPEACLIFFIDNKIHDRPTCYSRCLAKFRDGKVYAEIDRLKGCKCIDCTLSKR